MTFCAIEAGYIYILQNPAFSPDTLKIGKTRRDVYTRARELSQETGVPEDFVVAYSAAVWDVAQAERLLFSRLSDFRPKTCKEYFRLPVASAAAAAEEVVSAVNSQKRETLVERLKTWQQFGHEMRERDEALRQLLLTEQEYPELCYWLHDAPDPPEEV